MTFPRNILATEPQRTFPISVTVTRILVGKKELVWDKVTDAEKTGLKTVTRVRRACKFLKSNFGACRLKIRHDFMCGQVRDSSDDRRVISGRSRSECSLVPRQRSDPEPKRWTVEDIVHETGISRF